MECKVKWIGPDGMSFVAETESGHAFVMDGAPEGGGRNLGPRPMETVLAGTGGGTAFRVGVVFEKKRPHPAGFGRPPTLRGAGNHPQKGDPSHTHFALRRHR